MNDDKTPEELAEEFRKTYIPHHYEMEQRGDWCTHSTLSYKRCFLAGYAAALSKLKEAHDWGYENGIRYVHTCNAGTYETPNEEESFAEFQKQERGE